MRMGVYFSDQKAIEEAITFFCKRLFTEDIEERPFLRG